MAPTDRVDYRTYLRSEQWRELRGQALRRDGQRCRTCNGAEDLEVHHRRYPATWGTETLDDLTTLCRSCHEAITAHLDRQRYGARAFSFSPMCGASIQPQKVRLLMAYDTSRFRITGVSPLVMHNGQLADPTNRFAKEIRKISAKRKKTEADFAELARLEFLGSLYLDRGRPCLPGEILEACIVRGAVSQKRGKAARAGILCLGPFPLEYDGPRDPLMLWQQEEFRLVTGVKLSNSRVMRTRPVFREWAAEIEVKYNPLAVNAEEVHEFLATAGEFEGIGDWRPRFGRFSVQQV